MFHPLPPKQSAGRRPTPTLHRVTGYRDIRQEGRLDAQLANRLRHARNNASEWRPISRPRRAPFQRRSPLKRVVRKTRARGYLCDLAILHAEASGHISIAEECRIQVPSKDAEREASWFDDSVSTVSSPRNTTANQHQGTSWLDSPSIICSFSPPTTSPPAAPFLALPAFNTLSVSSTSTSPSVSSTAIHATPIPDFGSSHSLNEPWMSAGLDNVLLMERAARVARDRRRKVFVDAPTTPLLGSGSKSSATDQEVESRCENVMPADARVLGTLEHDCREKKSKLKGWLRKMSCFRK